MKPYCPLCGSDLVLDETIADSLTHCAECRQPLSPLALLPADAECEALDLGPTDTPPSAKGLEFLHRIVELSAELPPLAYGARPFSPQHETPTSAEAFMAELLACRAEATAVVERTVALQSEVDRFYGDLRLPDPPLMPVDQGLWNLPERQAVARLCASLSGRKEAERSMYDGLCTMLGSLWESLAKHLATVDHTLRDVQAMLRISNAPVAPLPIRMDAARQARQRTGGEPV